MNKNSEYSGSALPRSPAGTKESAALSPQASLLRRVVQAAEAALADHFYVSAIDVLCGMGLLAPTHVDSWRKGRIDYLERAIQGNLHKFASSMAMCRQWALEMGLKPSETRYLRRARNGRVDLRFSVSFHPLTGQS